MLLKSSENEVLVIGDVMLDEYWHGKTARISPEAPVPVVNMESTDVRAGGAANVALNIAALSSRSRVLGITGCDSKAEELSFLLEGRGINCSFVQDVAAPTITKLRIMSRHQQLLRVDSESKFSVASSEQLSIEAMKFDSVGAVVLSDYNKGSLQHTESIITHFKKLGIPVLVDPKGLDFKKYKGATLLTPNMAEFEAVVGHCVDEGDVVEKGKRLLDELDLTSLLVTRSEKGMTLFQRGVPPVYFAANARSVFDVTGAGDTVIATLASAISSGFTMELAAEIANIAGGIAVSKLGTDAVSLAELNSEISSYESADDLKVIDEETLLSRIEFYRANGDRIVMTNGCFDILHPGHVQYLEEAKKLGDRLVIAVNSDASVKRLKGASRPINDISHRMHVLAGLASADCVVEFLEDTPERLISRVLPDVLVKGGDYTADQIAGAEQVLKAGGEVKILNFKDGFSTSRIINSINESKVKSQL